MVPGFTTESREARGAGLRADFALSMLTSGTTGRAKRVAIGYAELGPSKLGKLTRGLLVKADDQGKALPCGPSAPAGHDVGAFVIDQRAWALCEWRIASGKFREYDGLEQVREAKDFVLAPELGREAYLALERSATTFGHVRAGERWQHAARVVGDVTGEPTYGCKLPVDDLRWFNPGTTVPAGGYDYQNIRTQYSLGQQNAE